MDEPWETIARIVVAIGIAVFLWSVSSSLEQIANALSRLADAQDKNRGLERSEEHSRSSIS